MKVTYIHQHFQLPGEDGGSRPYEFARRMAADGHDVTMICGGAKALKTEVEGIRVNRLAVPYRNAMSVPERMVSFARFMVKSSIVAAGTKADVVYASSTPLTVAVPGIVGKVFQRVPMIFEVRDLWPFVPIELGYLRNPLAIRIALTLETMAYRCAHSVVALSPGMKKGVLEVAPQKEVTVIPNACDFEVFDKTPAQRRAFRVQQGWGDDETVVVYAGGFGPTYHLEWVVRLAAAVRDRGIRFVLIGEGRDSQRLRLLAAELGLDVDSVLIGKRSKTEVAGYVAAADLVLSSLHEDPCLEVNSLNKVFDGLAAGRPILVNHEGWLKDAVVEAGAGWQLDRSLDTAVQQLTTIVSDPSGLERAGHRSRELGRARFDRDDLYRTLITVLENTVDA
ncbi:glycosyltransferase family 4 protein [Corynebacterium pacaense]|uniref:glycosyltransferase family 4 protein n=1 Tax=Corynebacterium pacaense TaxID=1816684 RepID=UPI0009BB9822|nr:glycosyltransferase family 4 protein [Corynebacterium pacaense]